MTGSHVRRESFAPMTTVLSVRPYIPVLLFRISHFLNLRAGGRSLFIDSLLVSCVIIRPVLSNSSAVTKSGRVIAWKAIYYTVEAAGLKGSWR